MYSYDDLFLFTKVVEIGSFLHTSKLLKISHTTIGRKIKNLENELGIVLIRRNTKNFEITEVGKQIYNSLRDSAGNVDILIDQIVKQKKEPQGTLNVLLPPVMALDVITPFIPDFLRRYPKININLCYQNREIDLVKDGFDIAILNHVPKQQTQKIRHVFSISATLYCTAIYAEKYGIPKIPAEIGDHLITGHLLDDGTVPANLPIIHRETGQVTIIDMPKRITTNNSLHNLKLLQTNEVICTILDTSDLKNLGYKIIQVLPDYYFESLKYYLLRHPHGHDLKIQVFCDFIETILNKYKTKF